MALDDLKEVVEKLQSTIDTHRDYLSGKERRTRQVLIDPLLKALGWDVSDPGAVYLEHNQMDYALMSNARPVAVIEAKPLGKSLEDDAITQAIAYAIKNNIRYIIVTNGDRWEMYEVFKEADLKDKRLMEFELSQPAHECALEALRIWEPNLASGSPKEAMKPVLDPLPDKIEDGSIPPGPAPVIDADGIVTFDGKTFKVIDDDWTGKKIGAFMFEDNTYKAKNGKDFFIKFFEILSKDKTLQFREVLDLNKAFSKDPDTFPPSAKQQRTDIMEIGKTGIHFNAHRDHERNKEIIISVVEYFECDMPIPLEEAD